MAVSAAPLAFRNTDLQCFHGRAVGAVAVAVAAVAMMVVVNIHWVEHIVVAVDAVLDIHNVRQHSAVDAVLDVHNV